MARFHKLRKCLDKVAGPSGLGLEVAVTRVSSDPSAPQQTIAAEEKELEIRGRSYAGSRDI